MTHSHLSGFQCKQGSDSHQHRESEKKCHCQGGSLCDILHVSSKEGSFQGNFSVWIVLHSLSSCLPSQVIRCTEGEQVFLCVNRVIMRSYVSGGCIQLFRTCVTRYQSPSIVQLKAGEEPKHLHTTYKKTHLFNSIKSDQILGNFAQDYFFVVVQIVKCQNNMI